MAKNKINKKVLKLISEFEKMLPEVYEPVAKVCYGKDLIENPVKYKNVIKGFDKEGMIPKVNSLRAALGLDKLEDVFEEKEKPFASIKFVVKHEDYYKEKVNHRRKLKKMYQEFGENGLAQYVFHYRPDFLEKVENSEIIK